MSLDVIVCAICRKNTPRAMSHDHHVRPQAAGGKDEDMIPLCSGCHANLHVVAHMLGGKKASLAEDTVKTYYGADAEAQRRCIHYAMEVVRWMTAKHDGKLQENAHDELEIIVTVPRAIKTALVTLGQEARDPATGKRLGIAGAVRAMIVQSVLRRFPALKNEIDRSIEAAARAGILAPKGKPLEPSRDVKRSVRK
jgi:hypothetical protein